MKSKEKRGRKEEREKKQHKQRKNQGEKALMSGAQGGLGGPTSCVWNCSFTSSTWVEMGGWPWSPSSADSSQVSTWERQVSAPRPVVLRGGWEAKRSEPPTGANADLIYGFVCSNQMWGPDYSSPTGVGSKRLVLCLIFFFFVFSLFWLGVKGDSV